MSAAICWEPTNKGHQLYVGAPQSFMDSLECIGVRIRSGDTIGQGHLDALRGMAHLYNNQEKDPKKNPYTQLIEAIEKHGEIRLWAEY